MAPNPNIYNVNYRGVETNLTPPNHRTPVWLAWLNVLLYPLQWIHNNFFSDYVNGSNYAFYSSATIYNIGDRVIDTDNAVYECEFNNVFNYSPHLNIGLGIGTYRFHAGIGSSGDALGNGAAINTNNFTGPPGIIYSIVTQNYFSFNWSDNRGNSGNNVAITIGVPQLLSYGVTVNFDNVQPGIFDEYGWTVATGVLWWQVSPDYRGVRPRTNFNGQKLVLEAILNQFFRTTFRQPSTAQNPDIFIVNNQNYPNTVFVCGYTEDSSSFAPFINGQAFNAVEYSTASYDYIDYAFTIYVPSALYFTLIGGASIENIVVDSGGLGYTTQPTVTITGGGGSGATAEAVISPYGFVDYFNITNAGTGYTSPPTIVLTGGGYTTIAQAHAVANSTTQGDNTIRNCANRYVIAGMLYNIQLY